MSRSSFKKRCGRCNAVKGISDFEGIGKGRRDPLCRHYRSEVGDEPYQTDDWPPMPEILKNQYWRIAK